jgi:sensor histidine kinase regulating citrate/malate metabolism
VKEVSHTPTTDNSDMKRLLTATEELAKRVQTLEEQNSALIGRLKIVEQQKNTGWEGGAQLSSEVRDLSHANTVIRENMRKLSADTHETVGPVRLKTIFETFLGEVGWKGGTEHIGVNKRTRRKMGY